MCIHVIIKLPPLPARAAVLAESRRMAGKEAVLLMELMSDGAIARIDAERVSVVALSDVLGGQYLQDDAVLSVRFPFEDGAKSTRLLTEQATARILVQKKDSLRLSFSSNAATKAVFAPSFQLLLALTVEGAGLRVECELNNIGMDGTLPFFLGVDVPMRCPLFEGEDAADYGLQSTVEAGGNTGTVRVENRRSGRGMEFLWEGLAFRKPDRIGPDTSVLTFGAQAPGENGGLPPLAPMESRRVKLRVTFL